MNFPRINGHCRIAWTGGSSPHPWRDLTGDERRTVKQLFREQLWSFGEYWRECPDKAIRALFWNRARHDAHATHRDLIPAQYVNTIRLLGAYTAHSFDPYQLAGTHKASVRAHIMSELAGVRVPQSKSGVTALRAALCSALNVADEWSIAQKCQQAHRNGDL